MKFAFLLDPGAFRSSLLGSFGLGFVSVAAYSVWAFLPRLAGSELGMYALTAAVYLGGSGFVLSGLMRGERRMPRFLALFIPAFLAYAGAWTATWFALANRNLPAEWIASLLGTQAFSLVAWAGLGRPRGYWKPSLVLFALHSCGYFAGSFLGHVILRGGLLPWEGAWVKAFGKLVWGAFHGIGFGAGMGWALQKWQAHRTLPSSPTGTTPA